MRYQNAVSLGCVDYGNNSFFEIMQNPDGSIVLASHDDDPAEENEDGTWNGDGDSVETWLNDISDRPDFEDIKKELFETIK